ncbi:putative bifunctional diguanylate cyclase/phosphodiesterase [Sporomusa sphaeroides]|uniref:putative bifunctional diguanylate cyclase/phosphodiesterase n=1 Tax=Sporomusa sphaeroides TaxID=47679 RepID=UPI0031597AAA
MANGFDFGISVIIVLLILIDVYLVVRINKHKRTEALLWQQSEELKSAQSELAAQEEELRQGFHELYLNEEKIRQHEELSRLVAEGANDALWVWDMVTDALVVSERGRELLGLPEHVVNTKEKWKQLIHPEDLPHMLDKLEEHLSGCNSFYGAEYRIASPEGGYRWVLSRGKVMFDSQGQPVRMAGSYTDITERKYKEEKIKHMAYYDALTGLANRELLTETVNQALAAARQDGSQGAVLFIDIDNFKQINDTYGHSWGDKLLVNISGKLTALVYEAGMVARWGGDEIIIFLPKINKTEEFAAYADKIMRLLEKPILVNEHVFYITASVGVALYPMHGDNIDELLRNADTAMYLAKNSGKRTYMMFNKTMHEAVVEKTLMEARLRRTLEQQELRLLYQPQINANSGRVEGFEALLRWESPDYGLVAPPKFISLAEETGLIVEMGNWVLEQACRFSRQLYAGSSGWLYTAVNISVVQLMQEDFVEKVISVLAETGVPPQYLELEITESVLMERFEENIRKLEALRELGVRIALDDFGSGYSSLTYLKKLPIAALKMDKAFVDDIAVGCVDAAITGSIIELAHQMGLQVVAEGVENGDQLRYLREKKCDIIQGYIISRPLPPEAFIVWLQQHGGLLGGRQEEGHSWATYYEG